MNTYWLNRQNKKHAKLYEWEILLNKHNMVSYFEIGLMLKNEEMNKRLSRMSQRRHKRDRKRIYNQIMDGNIVTEIDHEDIKEAFEELE